MNEVFQTILEKFNIKVIKFERSNEKISDNYENSNDFKIILKEVELKLKDYDKTGGKNTESKLSRRNSNQILEKKNNLLLKEKKCSTADGTLKLNDPLFGNSGHLLDDDRVEVLEIEASKIGNHHQSLEQCNKPPQNCLKIMLFSVFNLILCPILCFQNVVEFLNILLNISHKKVPLILMLYELNHINIIF